MSETENASGPPFERSPDLEYFRALERQVITLLGAPLQLSGEDYRVCKAWRAAGIPLELVRSVLEQAVERRRQRGDEVHRQLRYYRRWVTQAWKRQQQLQAPGQPVDEPDLDLRARLLALAGAVPKRPELAHVSRRILTLEGDGEALEAALAALDGELLAAAEGALDDAGRANLEDRLGSSLAALAGRLDAGDLRAAEGRLRAEILRGSLGLPLLSLFSPQATPRSAESKDAGDG